jgi:hypothetical protein
VKTERVRTLVARLAKGVRHFCGGVKQGDGGFYVPGNCKMNLSTANKHNKTILTKRIESSPTLREGWGRRNGGDRPGNYKMEPIFEKRLKSPPTLSDGKGRCQNSTQHSKHRLCAK